MTDQATEPLDLDAIRVRAERQIAAHARMLELNGGCGLLGVRHPEMFEDMLAWGNSTENEHADTILALIAEVERLRAATVKPEREAVARAFWNGYEHSATEREGFDAGIEAVRSLLPGRAEAEVKAEALGEAADDLAGRDFLGLGTGLPRMVACDYLRTRAARLAAEGGAS